MQSGTFRNFIFGDVTPKVSELSDTHTKLITIEAGDLDEVWARMQAECWSPSGEARPLIEEKELNHTSMSVGDVIYDTEKKLHYVVRPVGFDLFF
jgi:hypothetical protein